MKVSVDVGKTFSGDGDRNAQYVETLKCNAAPAYDGLHDGVSAVLSQEAAP